MVVWCTDIEGFNVQPKSDVIKFYLEGHGSVVVRPSGTEPKMKVYVSISAKNEAEANDSEKKVDLFALGADDYVTKPFDNDELLARIKSRLMLYDKLNNMPNDGTDKKDILEFKDIKLDMGSRIAFCNDLEISFSKLEFDILALLLRNKNRTCTKSMIYDIVWEYEGNDDDNALNVHISNIRKKLKKCNKDEEYIETVWGIGYRLSK